MFAFDPVSCAVAMSLLEHAVRPSRVCCRAKLWLRRAPDIIFDAVLNEAAEPALDTMNTLEHYYYTFLTAHRHFACGDVVVLWGLMMVSIALGALCAVFFNKR